MMMRPRRSLILPVAVSGRVSGIDARGILCLVMSRVQCRVGQIRVTDEPLLATSVQ